jgi:predicted DCC family thiol-disulfide oxidoreductase YuxK
MAQPFPIVKGKYIAGKPTKAAGSRLSAHVKYNQYRKLGEQETREDRFLFDQENNRVSRQDAVRDVMAHTSNKVLYHKIRWSPL